MFGSQERLIHPFGLVTLLAQSTSGTDIALRYSVPIEGVKCKTKLLCITRLLETTDINTRGIIIMI